VARTRKSRRSEPRLARQKNRIGTTGANRKGHALVDDIGNPTIPEQEDYGGAGDLGTTGAVGRKAARVGTVGTAGGSENTHSRIGPDDTPEHRLRSLRRSERKRR